MRFGIIVTNEQSGDEVVGLATAAVRRGWECRCFLTDRGVRLLMSAAFRNLAGTGGIKVDVCEFSWERFGEKQQPKNVVMGGQYLNAELVHDCDKVLVL